MANTLLNDHDYTITAADNGNTLVLNGASATGTVSGWLIHFVLTSGDAAFTVVARAQGQVPSTAAVAFLPVPYRRLYITGAVSDYTVVSAAIVATAIIQVPANGLAIGLNVTVTTGSARLFMIPVIGSTAI